MIPFCVFAFILGLSSEATVLTPNTESSCDLMTKTKSTSGNDDSTSLDLEWEDEEGISSPQLYLKIVLSSLFIHRSLLGIFIYLD